MNIKASLLLLLLIISSCSTEQASERISTSDDETQKVSELEMAIQGEWVQKGEHCNQKGEECEALDNEIKWVFEKGTVKWGGFTHHYKELKGTITIAGLPYKVASNYKDSLLFKEPEGSGFLLLIKEN